MVESQFKFGDWARMFIGEVPAVFFIELLLRSMFVYLLLLLSMRLLGKRMAAQLNRNELAAMVSLAAAVGVPIQAPDRGLLPALVVAIVIILISRGISMLMYSSPKVEQVSQGNYAALICEGVLCLREMGEVRITKDRLFSHLRERGIKHLGEVKRLYFEAGAKFTLVMAREPRSGLSVLPQWDTEFVGRQQCDAEYDACSNCGTLQPSGQRTGCASCRKNAWTTAVRSGVRD